MNKRFINKAYFKKMPKYLVITEIIARLFVFSIGIAFSIGFCVKGGGIFSILPSIVFTILSLEQIYE